MTQRGYTVNKQANQELKQNVTTIGQQTNDRTRGGDMTRTKT